MYRVNIAEIVEEDILSSVKYIANILRAKQSAMHLLDEIEKYEDILEKTPNLYPFVPDEYLAEKGLKFVRIKNYTLFYIIDEEKKIVNVVRFLYWRRDWQTILQNTLD